MCEIWYIWFNFETSTSFTQPCQPYVGHKRAKMIHQYRTTTESHIWPSYNPYNDLYLSHSWQKSGFLMVQLRLTVGPDSAHQHHSVIKLDQVKHWCKLVQVLGTVWILVCQLHGGHIRAFSIWFKHSFNILGPYLGRHSLMYMGLLQLIM